MIIEVMEWLFVVLIILIYFFLIVTLKNLFVAKRNYGNILLQIKVERIGYGIILVSILFVSQLLTCLSDFFESKDLFLLSVILFGIPLYVIFSFKLLAKTELRENGIIFKYRVLKWEDIDKYYWEKKDDEYNLLLKLKNGRKSIKVEFIKSMEEVDNIIKNRVCRI